MQYRRRLAGALLVVLAPVVCVSSPQFVGSARCTECHADEAAAWQTSHHAQAMQVATDRTVLGDFTDTKPVQLDGVQRFFRAGEKYFAQIGESGQAAQRAQIRYTFGVSPIQQYLVEAPGGRLQALSVAWDARAAAQGGQRWFSLHPDGLPARDSNWNFMCAACHSTNLRKNYSAAGDRYRTTWSDLNVACEACHGPGSAHLQWAHDGAASGTDKGLTVALQANRTVQWGFWSAGQRIASLRGALADARAQARVCFPCHSRRQALTDGGTVGHELLQDYLPQLIEPGVYRADGQIDAEDFEFGSFIQSKMYGQGVTCTNCHDAHSLKLRAEGNAVCTQCHRADVFDVSTHHHQRPQTDASRCISCHMPERTYMGVDRRRDHSFRIPNATTQFATAFDDAWSGAAATPALLKVLAQPLPALVRGSALTLLPAQTDSASQAVATALAAAIQDRDPLVRLGAARGITALEPATALKLSAPLLMDPMKAVRVEAARSLAGSDDEHTDPALRERLRAAVDELIGTEEIAAERPESHVNLAQIQGRLGHPADAERELLSALRLDPKFVPAMVNLADLYRAQNRESEAERWLRRAVTVAPAAAEPAHALGLLAVRQGHAEEALTWLRKAVALDADTARYSYVYAVALSEAGRGREAIGVVEAARHRSPKDESLRQLQQQLAAGTR
jgi:predicted CXXCH cytochrome family protein